MPRNVKLMYLYIRTWNVQSMYRTGTMTIIILYLQRYRLDITAVQEWDGSGSIKAHGFTTLYSDGKKHKRGVGFVIKDKLLSNLVKF
jgi:hypothetical protein